MGQTGHSGAEGPDLVLAVPAAVDRHSIFVEQDAVGIHSTDSTEALVSSLPCACSLLSSQLAAYLL